MKQNNDFSRCMTIQQYRGGYLISCHELAQGEPQIVLTFEEAVNVVARKFNLLAISEKVKLSPTPEGEKEGE